MVLIGIERVHDFVVVVVVVVVDLSAIVIVDFCCYSYCRLVRWNLLLE